jgi:hypothetical protein
VRPPQSGGHRAMSLAHAAMLPRRLRQLANEIGVTLDGPRPPLKPAPSPPGLRCIVLVGRLGHDWGMAQREARDSHGHLREPQRVGSPHIRWWPGPSQAPCRPCHTTTHFIHRSMVWLTLANLSLIASSCIHPAPLKGCDQDPSHHLQSFAVVGDCCGLCSLA